MYMGPSRCGRFPEVPLGQIRVCNSVNESQSLHREAIGSYRLETGHGDLDVDDWLSGQTRDRGGPYVVNAKSDVAKRCTQLCTQATEEAGPSSIIGNYFNSLRQQGPSDTLDGRKLVSTPALHYPVSFNLTAHEYRSFLVSIVYRECFSGGPNDKEGWTAGTRPSRQRIIVAWAGSHHRSKVDCTGDGLRFPAVQRPHLKFSVGAAYPDTCRPGAQRSIMGRVIGRSVPALTGEEDACESHVQDRELGRKAI